MATSYLLLICCLFASYLPLSVRPCYNTGTGRVSVNAQMGVFTSVKFFKNFQIVLCDRHLQWPKSKILDQDGTIRPLFLTLTETLNTGLYCNTDFANCIPSGHVLWEGSETHLRGAAHNLRIHDLSMELFFQRLMAAEFYI